MEWDTRAADGADIAARITEFHRDELDTFMRDLIRRRDLHRVVANLNASVLSKENPRSASARQALKRMGFTD